MRRVGGGLALAIAALAGCASGGDGRQTPPPSSAGTVTFEVRNTESPGTGLSVSLVSARGDRTLLGALGPRQTETFAREGLQESVSYRLVAGVTGSGEITSERFALAAGSTVTWTLPQNQLRVSR
ncbi:MAG: hypothetical protein ABR599_03415 [Gemmatimonadota bacterium]